MTERDLRDNERAAAAKKTQKQRRRKRRKQTAAVAVIALLIAVITLFILSLTVFFKIRTVEVTGSTAYTAQQVISASGITVGDNLWLLSEKKISEGLQKSLPFIEKVEIKRTLPDKVTLVVTETAEEAVISSAGKYYSANKQGKIIKEYDRDPEVGVIVTVADSAQIIPGEIITFSTDRETELFTLYFDMIEKYDFDVDFINITDPYDSYMKMEGRLIVKFGASSYFENKAEYLKASLDGISEDSSGIFDLSSWSPENDLTILTHGDISEYKN